jgi:hypothetical protein
MKSKATQVFITSIVVAIMAVCLGGPQPADVLAQVATQTATGANPVESDMHEFMEYVFSPTYERLKASMASLPPTTRAGRPSNRIR